jgi:hypothetical protein
MTTPTHGIDDRHSSPFKIEGIFAHDLTRRENKPRKKYQQKIP